MKKNLKKTLSVFMAALMLLSVVGVSAYAAYFDVTIDKGTASGVTPIDPNFKPIVLNYDSSGFVVLPNEVMFTRSGYTQDGWTTSKVGTGAVKKFGSKYKATSTWNNKLYPHWKIDQIDVTFAPGADGVGAEKVVKVNKGQTTKFPADIFTRPGYIMIGWTTTENGAKEFELGATTPSISAPTTFYPVWLKAVFKVDFVVENTKFFSICEEYTEVETGYVTITNKGNAPLTYTLPSNTDYNIQVVSGNLTIAPEESLKLSISPKLNLPIADHSTTLLIKANQPDGNVSVPVSFEVVAHSFDKYVSNGDATYTEDGTMTAHCSNGCGKTDTKPDDGSMKVYSSDNNTVEGLNREYLHHKTVHFTVYGSGMDNVQTDGSYAEGTLRYVPTSWYVNEQFNGEFTDGNYEVKYVHKDFGNFKLQVNYVEEKLENGQWVKTGVEDVKTFNYSIGPSETDEQEVVVPNMIVTIIFGLLGQLFEMVKAFLG